MPPNFRRFLGLIKDQLYLYEGLVIIFDESYLFKKYLSRMEIKAFPDKLERENVIRSVKIRYGLKVVTIPTQENRRKKYLGWFDWSFLSDRMTKRQIVFEVVSRNAFSAFFLGSTGSSVGYQQNIHPKMLCGSKTRLAY